LHIRGVRILQNGTHGEWYLTAPATVFAREQLWRTSLDRGIMRSKGYGGGVNSYCD